MGSRTGSYTPDASILNGLDSMVNTSRTTPGVDLRAAIDHMLGDDNTAKAPHEVMPDAKFNEYLQASMQKLGIDDMQEDIKIYSNPVVDVLERPASPTEAFEQPRWDAPARADERQRQARIADVVDRIPHEDESSISFESLREEDIKCDRIGRIDSLRAFLKEEGVDIGMYPEVDMNSSSKDVEVVMRRLEYKVDQSRYCSMANELILFGVYGMEELFNGKRNIMGRKPDLRGWHNSVGVKLRRMKHETSAMVSGLLDDFKISNSMRILLELIPNGILYSMSNKTHINDDDIFDDSSMASAGASLRDDL